PDGLVTVDELTTYLTKEGPERARELGKDKDEKDVTPLVLGGARTHFALTRNPAQTATVKKHLDKLAELATAGTVNAEVAAEGKDLLARMPKLKYKQELRKLYEKLTE